MVSEIINKGDWMRVLISIVLLLMMANSVSAENRCFRWTDNDPLDKVTFYTIYEDSRNNPFIKDIPYGDPTACQDVTRLNTKEYFITANNNEGESGNSNRITIPPTPTAPNTVKGFAKVIITIEFE